MFWISALIMVAMFIPISIMLTAMPFLTRETVSFGVSVSEEMYYSPQLRQMRRRYAWISGSLYTLLLLACLFLLLGTGEKSQPYVLTFYISVVCICSAVINLMFYLKMKKAKAAFPQASMQSGRIAVDTKFRSRKMTISNKWFLLHIGVMLVSTVLAVVYYDSFPSSLAMKFDWQGNVIRSVPKSLRTVLGLNLMQLVMIALFMFINWTILKSKQQINPDHPEQSAAQNAVFRLRWSMFNAVSGMIMVLLFSLIQLNMRYEVQGSILMIVSLLMPSLIVIMALVISLTTGQGGRRIGRPALGTGTTAINDDRYWKLGLIYFNPSDPAMFIEKRMGIGWTINFARPAAWLIIVGILVIVTAAGFIVS
ncbi:DUF5808 domain-containing protein [Paenibacillus sp. KQZ6P-2]|uniref:DUF5808 domain-containing protein n=1 Tax=Paenibacillus mangrovi TaxID=2931978 RepID=A0A9X1WTX2_9BACL|nr:DUF5808 domain-containing protein [Paenibacillus mangrovi]MCJ8011749.1 DUF5808 domain-containing protein [Paenibacillus mangrovi]